MTWKVLVTDPIASDGLDILRRHAEVEVRLGLPTQELATIIGGFDGLVVRSETRVTAPVIDAATHLQVIGRAGVGVDNIDLEAATRRGIVVVNTPTANTVSAAEHTLALLLAVARHIPQANALLKQGKWQRNSFVGVEVRNKTLGIVGLGQVGSEVARRAQGLEMRVIAHDPFISLEHAHNLGVELVSLPDLLSQSGFISLHVPLTPQTQGLIGHRELALMKPGAYLINTARGGIIDEEALAEALALGGLAGAAVDVFAEEPPRDSPLLRSDKAIITPHLGASTVEAQADVAVAVAEQVVAVLQGHPARYAVNAPFIPPEMMAAVGPFLGVASHIGKLATQLAEGQLSAITIKYEGDIANYEAGALKVALLGGLLEPISEERVNLVNANMVAAKRGLRIMEQKEPVCENYGSLITVEVTTSAGTTTVAGTYMRGETHIVHVNGYWVDVVASGGYWLVSHHRDRPGLIGAVGTILGNGDINISSMQVSRLQPRGPALMVLGMDEPVGERQLQHILDLPDVYTAKVVRL